MSEGTDKQQHDVFDPATIPMLGNTVRKQWVRIPEWGNREVCMWGTDSRSARRIADETRAAGDNPIEAQARNRIATIIHCARDGDGADAKPIFDTVTHWGWLEGQGTSVTDRLFGTVQELDRSTGFTQEALYSFFAMTHALQECLRRIGSHSGACTDCPESCQPTCPQKLFGLLLSPTPSSESEKTDGSATSAPSSSSDSNAA